MNIEVGTLTLYGSSIYLVVNVETGSILYYEYDTHTDEVYQGYTTTQRAWEDDTLIAQLGAKHSIKSEDDFIEFINSNYKELLL